MECKARLVVRDPVHEAFVAEFAEHFRAPNRERVCLACIAAPLRDDAQPAHGERALVRIVVRAHDDGIRITIRDREDDDLVVETLAAARWRHSSSFWTSSLG